MRMFGTNGVRGIANGYLSCELALQMGKSIGKVLGRRIAVAMDPRLSSNMVKYALCSGLMSVGTDVIDLGMIPTPALQYYVHTHREITGGVMITASHNPPEYNGIKCISGDGTECSPAEESAIEDVYDTRIECVDWKSIGSVKMITGAVDEYIDAIISRIDIDAIRNADLTVCVDCANGASTETTPLLMRRLGVRTVTLNGNPQGEFPGHPSEPVEENLSELKRMVVDLNADLGIAHDGDADRCVFVTEEGEYVSGDCTLALLAESAIEHNPDGTVVVTVATSKIVEDVTNANGGVVEYTAVGSPVVARRMISNGGVFGGEENGGLIFADHQFCRDGAMGAAKMLERIASKGPLSKQIRSLPKYITIKRAVECPDELKTEILESLAKKIDDGRLDRTDGLRIDFNDGWVLLRPSGTEPKFRIYSESKDRSIAESRADEYVEKFKEALRTFNP